MTTEILDQTTNATELPEFDTSAADVDGEHTEATTTEATGATEPAGDDPLHGDFAALDNSDPPQWWTWMGTRDESAEPWHYIGKPPHRPGDVVYGKEAFCHKVDDNARLIYNTDGNLDPSCYWYKVDGDDVLNTDGDGFICYRKDGRESSPWASPVQMPIEAARLFFRVDDVRPERLQDITPEDAIASGTRDTRPADPFWDSVAMQDFRGNWDVQHGKRHPWADNPYVWKHVLERIEKP